MGDRLHGAPWADGPLGGVLGVNADHAMMHWNWVTRDGLADLRRTTGPRRHCRFWPVETSLRSNNESGQSP
ncbi:MAG TPA: hypothetical protein VND89_01890 [Acidimicrobiales bacterium]|nr:hypothetical protein [Acidimicrobiales bacterium]